MAPNTRDHHLVVKVVSERVLIDREAADGNRLFHAHYVVADDTGCAVLDVHQDYDLTPDSLIALHNVSTKLVRDRMRIVVGKWGTIEPTTRTIRGHILTTPNFSDVDYSAVDTSETDN